MSLQSQVLFWKIDMSSNTDLTGDISSISGPHKVGGFIGHGIQASSFDFQLEVFLIFFL